MSRVAAGPGLLSLVTDVRLGCSALLVALASVAEAQIPDTFQNLRHLSEDITRDSLLQVMRGFSFALGVRCQYCHVGGDGISFEGVEFHKDDDPDKRKARFMLAMVDSLNRRVLPLLPERGEPGAVIECKTCHRGLAKPTVLTQELRRLIDSAGVDSAAAKYRELRASIGLLGIFDFGEWETNVVAERLERDGRVTEAIAIYELNYEYYPESPSIAFALGRLSEREGETATAVRWYERTLELHPANRRAQERLAELRSKN